MEEVAEHIYEPRDDGVDESLDADDLGGHVGEEPAVVLRDRAGRCSFDQIDRVAFAARDADAAADAAFVIQERFIVVPAKGAHRARLGAVAAVVAFNHIMFYDVPAVRE